jgi:hypothetical protein
MKQQTKQKILGGLAGGLITAAAFTLGGCPNDTTPPSDPKCECPEGTTHANGETCCEGDNCNCGITPPAPECKCPAGTLHEPNETCCDGGADCECKEVKYYNATFDDKIIPIEDRSGERVTQKELDIIQGTLTSTATDLSMYNNPALEKVKRNLSKIIVKDIESGNSDRSGGIIYLDFDYLSRLVENDFSTELDDQIWNIILDDSLTFNKPNSDIRLTNGKNINIGGRQASFAYVAYQNRFNRNGSAGVPGTKFLDKKLSNGICHLVHG